MNVPLPLLWKSSERIGIVGDVHIGPPIVVVVEDERRESKCRTCFLEAGGFGHVGERPVVVGPEEHVVRSLETVRAAHHAEPFPVAVAAAARRVTHRVGVRDIRRDKQIQPAVAVEVDERAPCIPARARQRESGPARDIAKGAVTVVAIQNLIAVVGDEEIDVAVVVVVAGADALSPAPAADSRLGGDVGEGPIA